ncbi:hypothetical protein ACHQM5_016068 [Ranunculus cassubicifolius]
MFSTFILLLLFSSTSANAELQPTKNIFILAGQSNMAGRGGVFDDKWDGVVPTQCQPNPLIFRLSAELDWEEAKEPLHADIDLNRTCGVGPGMAFANAIQEMVPKIGSVGLVPCAIGGTNISEWRRGMKLYNQLVYRTKASLEGGGTIRAMLWYQGESDTINRVDAENYQANLEEFFEDLRHDLQFPRLPIIQVALASAEGPYEHIVRHAQLGLRLLNVWCVDAKGLQLKEDHLHLTTLAQVRLGQMLAQEFIRTLQSPTALIHNTASTSNSHTYSLQDSCKWMYLLICAIIIIM